MALVHSGKCSIEEDVFTNFAFDDIMRVDKNVMWAAVSHDTYV